MSERWDTFERGYTSAGATSSSQVLSDAQLAVLAEHGDERTAEVGEFLFGVGDRRYPFIAIIEGEAAVQGAAGAEIVRHGASGFLGEMNLLTGQTVFLNAVVTQPMRYIAVDRDDLRSLLFEDGPLSELLLSTFMVRREGLQQEQGIGLEVLGPRSSQRLGGSSSTPGAAVSRTPGATPSTRTTPRPRRSSARSTPASSRWCGSRAGTSSIRPTARCLARSDRPRPRCP